MTAQTNVSASVPMPKWIKQELFEKVLKECVNNYRSVKKFEVKPGSAAGENYATLMLRVEIDVELEGGSIKPISFMIKTAHDSDAVREMFKSHNVFDVEKCMYDDIVPEFEKLYADAGVNITFGAKSYVLDTEHPYILLENLSPKGFKNANRLEGLDTEHTESVLRKLAKWHAASAVYAANRGGFEEKYLHGMFNEENKEMMKIMLAKLTPILLNCAKKYSNYEVYAEELEASSSTRLDAVYSACRCDPNEFNVLNHGDCWANNIMFQYDNSGKIKETYLIDYQMPKYGTPAQDLFYFLLSSTNYEVKLSKFDYFIRFYHDNLRESLQILKYTNKIPTLCEIHKMLYKYSAFALSTASGIMAIVLLDPSDDAKLDNFVGDSDEGDAFKMLMYSNARYRKHAEAVLPWLQNRGALAV